ncbi:MAG: hypothetical protein RIB65_14310 [Ilumatobacter fluminis]|uniref:hypothetical protein n=1 Tax=Ilumatobacter fluminis TaxID=467091 RepID=UPI0032EB8813
MTDDQFPNDPTEPIPPVGGPSEPVPPVGGPTDPTVAQPVVPPPGPGGEPGGAEGRPAWLVPAGAGLAIGLVIALIAVLVVRGGDDDDEAATSTTVETIATVPETTTAPTTVPTTTAPATTAPATTAPATTAPATTTPPPTTAPATTTPATTEPAPTTTAPGGLTPASPGSVRIADAEYPIQRLCQTLPFVGFTGDYAVDSYLYFDDVGNPWVVDRWFDEGGATGVYFGDELEVVDLGADGFGFFFFEGDGEVPAAVNPTGIESAAECGGSVVERMADGAQRTYTIVDICLGNDPTDGTLRYAASLSEQGVLELAPNADASYRAFLLSAIGDPFAGVDEQAVEPAPPADGRFQVDMVLTQTVNGSEQRTAQADIIDAAVRDCG